MVDYNEDYQGDVVPNNYEDPLTSAMILLARAISQRFSNPTNNRLRTSSNTKNQAIIQGDKVNIKSRNSRNDGRNTRRLYVQEELVKGNNVHNDAGNIQRTLRTMSSGTVVNVQCYNYSEKGMFMLGPKPMSFYDSKVKHGLGYTNPYTLKKAFSQNPKLYDAFCFDDSKIQMNVRDTEDILDDATKSQIKITRKSQDPTAIEKKQNFWTTDYRKLNALYEDFVPQEEFSAAQKYFSSSFISSENSSNASSLSSSSETKPIVTLMPSAQCL
nr:hypothetical protein [Tanacetum cinerariifolium]